MGGNRVGTYEFLNVLVGAIALLLLCAHAVRVAVSGLRQRRAGAPMALVGAGMTSQLIGLSLAVAGAISGGYIIISALRSFELQPVPHLMAQVFAASVGSWLIGRAYFGWLVQPVYNWFAGEEGAGRDR